MRRSSKNLLIPLTIVMGITFSLNSCIKEQPTVAKIRIVDNSGAPVSDAEVRLFPTPTISPHGSIVLDHILYTDGDGYATFNYTDDYKLGQAGFAVLDIEAQSGDSIYGVGIIKIEEEKINTEQVIIQ